MIKTVKGDITKIEDAVETIRVVGTGTGNSTHPIPTSQLFLFKIVKIISLWPPAFGKPDKGKVSFT